MVDQKEQLEGMIQALKETHTKEIEEMARNHSDIVIPLQRMALTAQLDKSPEAGNAKVNGAHLRKLASGSAKVHPWAAERAKMLAAKYEAVRNAQKLTYKLDKLTINYKSLQMREEATQDELSRTKILLREHQVVAKVDKARHAITIERLKAEHTTKFKLNVQKVMKKSKAELIEQDASSDEDQEKNSEQPSDVLLTPRGAASWQES